MADVETRSILELVASRCSGPAGMAVAQAITGKKVPSLRDLELGLADSTAGRTCVDDAKAAFEAVRTLLTPNAVQRLRRMSLEVYEPFPDVLLRVLVTLTKQLNAQVQSRKGEREQDRTASQLRRVCELYAASVGRIQRAHKGVSAIIPEAARHAIKAWVDDEARDDAQEAVLLKEILQVPPGESLRAVLNAYVAESAQSLWVTEGEPL